MIRVKHQRQEPATNYPSCEEDRVYSYPKSTMRPQQIFWLAMLILKKFDESAEITDLVRSNSCVN